MFGKDFLINVTTIKVTIGVFGSETVSEKVWECINNS